MNDRQYKIHVKECYRINKHPYFRKKDLDPLAVISEALLILHDDGIEYNPDTFYLVMWKVLNKEWRIKTKNNPKDYIKLLQRQNDWKARNRKKVGDWYCKHLLRKKYSAEHIKQHPELVEQKRQELLFKRKNGNNPISIEIPPIPDGLVDLQQLNIDYRGYAISPTGDFYSCKGFNKWKMLSRRKDGVVRFNIMGVKKNVRISSLLNKCNIDS